MNAPITRQDHGKLWRAAARVVDECEYALLSTADGEGHPHCTWMYARTNGDLDEVFSITAPTTHKVANLRQNPWAEWMFNTPPLETVVYLSGPTEIIEGEAVRPYWDVMPHKAHAYYHEYCNSDDPLKFVIVRTQVQNVVYCRPEGYRKSLVYEASQKVCAN